MPPGYRRAAVRSCPAELIDEARLTHARLAGDERREAAPLERGSEGLRKLAQLDSTSGECYFSQT